MKNLIFSLKNSFLYVKKYFFQFKIGSALIDPNEIFPIKLSSFKISHSVESYDKKIVENSRIFYDSKERIISNLLNIYF